MNNKNLTQAKKAKNDEFYTQMSDIEAELKYYTDFFNDKVVYCNCDDYERSNFYKYFKNNFDSLKLKKVIATCYNPNGYGIRCEYDSTGEHSSIMYDNGDFRNNESVSILKECDVVVTNCPFSLFREYITQIYNYGKKYLVIGNLNAVTHKEIFPYIMREEAWMGVTYFQGGAAHFIAPNELYDPSKMSNEKNAYFKDGKFYWRVNGVRWFTNIDNEKRHTPLKLTKSYNENDYPKYDNYDAINVDSVYDIPYDYDGVVGVPISWIDKQCVDQFKIIGTIGASGSFDVGKANVNGVKKYKRILIQKKNAN